MRAPRGLRAAFTAVTLVTTVAVTTPANAVPIYPMILVTITARAGVVPTYTISAQFPPVGWSCAQSTWGAGTYTLVCQPPVPLQTGLENTCIWNLVTVQSAGIPGTGPLTAHTRCDNDAGATTSTMSGGANSAFATPNIQFTRFFCQVSGGQDEPAMRPWSASCTNNH